MLSRKPGLNPVTPSSNPPFVHALQTLPAPPAPARPFTVKGDGMGVSDWSSDTGVRCGVDGPDGR